MPSATMIYFLWSRRVIQVYDSPFFLESAGYGFIRRVNWQPGDLIPKGFLWGMPTKIRHLAPYGSRLATREMPCQPISNFPPL